jgi:hypothetical protein
MAFTNGGSLLASREERTEPELIILRSWRALSVIACVALAGCGPAVSAASPAASTGATPASVASSTAPAASSCRLLTSSEVSSALGVPVEPAKRISFGGCLFSITGGAGAVNIGVISYGSPSAARADLQGEISADSGCCEVAQVDGIGQQAISITGSTTGSAVLAAIGKNVLTVNIGWQGAAEHPEMAARLAHDAAARL